ncbi:hypothetical protein [Pseudomonas trivialis]|uniref:hypothetical protein n=1 Tax=Pseudomonas trivialis TaxID=200450 RepID=UPI000AB55263|nr:hypothetical protein [Pseudomonas trivialis]
MALYECLIVKNGDLTGAIHDSVEANSEAEAIEAMRKKYPKYDTFSCYTRAPKRPHY